MVSVLEVRERARRVDRSASDGAAEASGLALHVLEGFAATRRFSLLLMFLEPKQKGIVKAVFAELKRLGTPPLPPLAKAWEA